MGDYTDYYDLVLIDATTGEECSVANYGDPISPVLSGLMFDIRENGWGDLASHIQADPHKWYEHHYDLEELSKQYPDVTFVLYGNPEYSDPEDAWRLVVRNGKASRSHPDLRWPALPDFARGPTP